MHRDQLALQMSGELGEMECVSGQGIEHLFTIGLALCGQLQVEQAAVPGWNLHALVAQTAHPARDILQVVERSRVTGKLGQEDCRALDGLDGHREFALRNIRQLIYTSLQISVGASVLACANARAGRDLSSPQFTSSRLVRRELYMRGSLHALIAVLLLFSVCRAQEAPASQSSPSVPSSTATLEQAQPKPRLKIGVALEGGGALGLAHVGVLQWFEDHHIPIDYLAGTSMGGLIGGLYATGKAPKELQDIVEQQSWDIIIGGKTPYQDLSFRRKEDNRDYPTFIQFGLKNGLSLPAGLNAGHQISLLIDRETLPYANLKSFDDLPIPYRCVATDLVSGKEVVFKDGSLPQAMRATMSIPGLFNPVRRDNQVLVDGGLVGNLPTDVVRAMGAEVVIAIHLEVAPAKPDEIQSLFSVLGRSVDVIVRENEIRGLAGADLVVSVDLHEFSSLDYGKSRAIIDVGRKATEAKARVLEPFALNDNDWQTYLQARGSRRRSAIPIPQFIRVEGTDPDAARHIEAFLQPLVGKPLDTTTLDGLLTRLTGIGKFDAIGYREINDGVRTGLLIEVHEKSYAPPLLQFASEVDGSETADVSFTQAARLTLMDVAGYRSEWRTDLLFGNTYGISTELYKPL